MKVLLQRVNRASVEVDGEPVGSIEKGLLLLVGFGKEDSREKLAPMAEKLTNLRVFPDEKGRFHHSVLDVHGQILLVPQFTLYGETVKGRRPDFFAALDPREAEELFELFSEAVRSCGVQSIETGRFGAYMQVALENDGPVTMMLES